MRHQLLKQTFKYNLVLQRFCTGSTINKSPGSTSVKHEQGFVPKENVTGLSSVCVSNNEPVGPGASRNGEYKVPEYFNYNKMSYFEAEVEMAQFRCPQPSARKN